MLVSTPSAMEEKYKSFKQFLDLYTSFRTLVKLSTATRRLPHILYECNCKEVSLLAFLSFVCFRSQFASIPLICTYFFDLCFISFCKFMHKFSCKHALALAIHEKLTTVPRASLRTAVGRKRKRGRPYNNPGALRRLPYENAAMRIAASDE